MPDQNPYAKWGGTLVPEAAPAQAPPTEANPYAKWGGTIVPTHEPPTGVKAAQPGAYQQTRGGEIRNAPAEAANPFSDTTTSVIPDMLGTKAQGALAQRPDETFSQFMARARDAAKSVNSKMIEVEHRGNIARTIPTLGAAALAGPAQIGAVPLAAEALELSKPGYDKLVELAKTPLGKEALKYVLKLGLAGELYRHRHLLDLLK